MNKTIKLDIKDRKILTLITEDAKAPLKKIAKAVGLSREVVNYRIKRLEKEGIIKKYLTKINMTLFYQNGYIMYVRLQRFNQEILNKAVDTLVNNPFTMWVATLSGDWDIAISLLTRTPHDLDQVIKELKDTMGNHLKDYELLNYTNEIKNTFRDLLGIKLTKAEEDMFMIKEFSPSKMIKFDDTNKQIIKLLSLNAKLNNSEIAKQVGLTEEATRQRIKQLEKQGVIQGYRGIIDIYKLDQEIYYILMNFDISKEREKEIETFFKLHPNVYYSARLVGKYNIVASMTAENRKHYQKIINEIREKFADILDDFSTTIIFKELKHTYLPLGCLELENN